MNNLFAACQLVGGIIMSVGYFPQIMQILKTRTSKGLNLKSFGMIFVGILLYEFYAVFLVVNGSGHMYLVTNSVSLLLSGSMCILIKIFEEKENSK